MFRAAGEQQHDLERGRSGDRDATEIVPLLHAAPRLVPAPSRQLSPGDPLTAGAGAGLDDETQINLLETFGRPPSGASVPQDLARAEGAPQPPPRRLGGALAPLRCRAAFECAAALAESPRLPAAGDADAAWSAPRAAALVLIVSLSLVALWYATPANVFWVVQLMRRNTAWSIALFTLAFTAGVILMLPGMLFSVAAGAAFGFGAGAAVSFVSTVTGMTIAFLLGRYLLHDLVAAELLKRVPNFKAIDRAVAEEGWKLVLLLRLSPLMPYNVMNYVMGATSIRLVPYALPSAAAALLYSCLFAYLGSAADDLLLLMSGGASASVGGAWLAAAGCVGLCSAYGLLRICQRLILAPPGGDAGGGARPKDGPPQQQQQEQAQQQQQQQSEQQQAAAGGAGGGQPAKEGGRPARASGAAGVVGAGGCGGAALRAVNTYVITNPSFGRVRRMSVTSVV